MNVRDFRRSEHNREMFARSRGFQSADAMDRANVQAFQAWKAERAAREAARLARVSRALAPGCKAVKSARVA